MFINIFTKDPDYAMKIMESCVVLNELEGASTRRYFIDSIGTEKISSLRTVSHLGFISDTDINFNTTII